MARFFSAGNDGTPLAPTATVLLLMFAAGLPLPMLGTYSLYPNMALCALFFWSLQHPSHAHPLLVFLLGLLADSIAGMPLGVHVLILFAARAMVLAQRRLLLAQPFFFVWIGAALVILCSVFAMWLVLTLYQKSALPFMGFFVHAMATALFYPVMHGVLEAMMGKRESH